MLGKRFFQPTTVFENDLENGLEICFRNPPFGQGISAPTTLLAVGASQSMGERDVGFEKFFWFPIGFSRVFQCFFWGSLRCRLVVKWFLNEMFSTGLMDLQSWMGHRYSGKKEGTSMIFSNSWEGTEICSFVCLEVWIRAT